VVYLRRIKAAVAVAVEIADVVSVNSHNSSFVYAACIYSVNIKFINILSNYHRGNCINTSYTTTHSFSQSDIVKVAQVVKTTANYVL